MKLETVQIENGQGGFRIINQCDFNPEKHKLFKGEGAKEEPAPEPISEPAENDGEEATGQAEDATDAGPAAPEASTKKVKRTTATAKKKTVRKNRE